MEPQQFAAAGPLGAQQGLWDMLQQQQQGRPLAPPPAGPGVLDPSPVSSPHFHPSHLQQPAPVASMLHPGVLSGRPLSTAPVPGSYQVPSNSSTSSAYAPAAAALPAFPGGLGLPQQQQQLVAPLKPLSGAALAAAAHLQGGSAGGLSGGMAGLNLALPPSRYIQQQQQQPGAHGGAAAAVGPGGGPAGSGSGGASPPAHLPPMVALAPLKQEPLDSSSSLHTSSHSANHAPAGSGGDAPGSPGGSGSPGGGVGGGGGSMNKSNYRGVSYDRKKGKWRVQIKVAALGKSGVSVGYFDTEEGAARAYDRAAIGLLGIDNPNLQTNFNAEDYAGEAIPRLSGKTREEVKTTLKSERIKQAPRRRFTTRQRTSRFMGVGSSNRKNQWQARILVHGKVTHLGYYETEEEAARVYDRVSLALHGEHAQTNFPAGEYAPAELEQFRGLEREDLQRALGVKPMDKSSRFRGVSKKKGKWEAKVMVNRRWAYRELFDSEEEAARAYDRALWRLKPKEAHSYVNFKDQIPAEVADMLARGGDADHHHHHHHHHHGRSHRGRGAAARSSEDEASEQSEDDGFGLSDDEDYAAGGRGGRAAAAMHASPTSASGRPRRAAAMRGSPAKAAAAALAAAAAPPPARASPRQAAAAAAGPAAAAPALPPANWFDAAVAGNVAASPSHMGGLRSSGSAPNLAALGGAFPPGPGPASYIPGAPAGVSVSRLPAHLAAGGAGGSPAAPLVPGFTPDGQPSLQYAQPLPPSMQAPAQPLLVRVGSETHLISHAQQAQHAPAQQAGGAGSGGSGTTLGKRMSRIQSEPHFPTMLDPNEPGILLPPAGGAAAVVGEVDGLMSDRDLLKSIGDFGGAMDDAATDMAAAMALDAHLDDTDGILDFIKDLPDINPVSAAAGGMFKSRSAVNLSSLGSLWAEEETALAALEFSRPKKMSRSMSMRELGGLAGADAGAQQAQLHAAHVSPPHSSPSASSDSGGTSGERLGPLGQPIRRTNTFTASLATLEEREHHLESEELHNNAAAAAALAQHAQHAAAAAAAAAEPPAALAGHMHLSNSGDDLVQQLLGTDHSGLTPHPGDASMDDPLHIFHDDDFAHHHHHG